MDDFLADTRSILHQLRADRRGQRLLFITHLGIFALATGLASSAALGLTGFCLWMLWAWAFILHVSLYLLYEIEQYDTEVNLTNLIRIEPSEWVLELPTLKPGVPYAIGDDGELTELDDEPPQPRKRE